MLLLELMSNLVKLLLLAGWQRVPALAEHLAHCAVVTVRILLMYDGSLVLTEYHKCVHGTSHMLAASALASRSRSWNSSIGLLSLGARLDVVAVTMLLSCGSRL